MLIGHTLQPAGRVKRHPALGLSSLFALWLVLLGMLVHSSTATASQRERADAPRAAAQKAPARAQGHVRTRDQARTDDRRSGASARPRTTQPRAQSPSGGASRAAAARDRSSARQRASGSGPTRRAVAKAAPERPTHAKLAGLHNASDPLDLKSAVALVVDQDTQEVLVSKNDHAVLPIASLTKIMTAMLVLEAHLNPDEPIAISQEDVDTEKGSRSRLAVGSVLSRGELLHLALMSSENRAAHALGRSYPGGMEAFVRLMNQRAHDLGMRDTQFVEPTGLSSRNQSSARDLAVLVRAAYGLREMRELSTSPGHVVEVNNRQLQYNNTNRLVLNPQWDIGLQKTGYISEAGRCLVMQAQVSGRKLIMVFLDSAGKFTRLADAERVRRWVESQPAGALKPRTLSLSLSPATPSLSPTPAG
jgi:serine-type D-Ala-D-Ala endopeptidase (penicillin-binding protein 7)